MALDKQKDSYMLLEDGEEDKEAREAVEQVDQPFSGLDLKSAKCFGSGKEGSWRSLAEQAESTGIQMVDMQKIEKSLSRDVDSSYFQIARFQLEDLADGLEWTLWFDNNKALWKLMLKDSPEAEVSPEQTSQFFKSMAFKKISKKAWHRLIDAKRVFKKIVKPLIEDGRLLLVDTVKLDAILEFLDEDYFLKNLLEGKHTS